MLFPIPVHFYMNKTTKFTRGHLKIALIRVTRIDTGEVLVISLDGQKISQEDLRRVEKFTKQDVLSNATGRKKIASIPPSESASAKNVPPTDIVDDNILPLDPMGGSIFPTEDWMNDSIFPWDDYTSQ